ncbi:MAG: hypothetical protein RQ855_07925 [Desulfurococcales archaeon]|nr:hypothetical protein [Desulfurococcales archaeon]
MLSIFSGTTTQTLSSDLRRRASNFLRAYGVIEALLYLSLLTGGVKAHP